MLSHRRLKSDAGARGGIEQVSISAPGAGGRLRLEHALPPSQVIDDLKLTVRLKADRPGGAVGIRVVYPNQTDPRTGEPLVTIIGAPEIYAQPDSWQELTCTSLESQLVARQRILRRQIQSDIDTRGRYADRAVVEFPITAGTTTIRIDEIALGPVVSPRNNEEIIQIGFEDDPVQSPLEFRLDRLLLEGRPFFPVVAPYHGEQPAQLADDGINVVWAPDYRQYQLLKELRQQGLWCIATPPRLLTDETDKLKNGKVSLLPFSRETAPIIAWYAGTLIPADRAKDTVTLIDQIRAADQHFNRPVMADVGGSERLFSRHVGLLGTSRHVLHTEFPLIKYRDWLIQRGKLALPGSFQWTWIQTEPATANVEYRQLAGKPAIVVEPEQIRLQVYAACAAGCRGIGYWNNTSFDSKFPGALERQLAIRQINLELQLIGPWLSTGTLVGQSPFEVERLNSSTLSEELQQSPPDRGMRFGTPRAVPTSRRSTVSAERDPNASNVLEAATFKTDFGLLLLPIWYQDGAQYVPGKMAGENAKIVVENFNVTARAYEVSTTRIQSLPSRRITGGTEITLPVLDMTAAIVVTSDRDFIRRIEHKMKAVQERSARTTIDLAAAKLQRVGSINSELGSLKMRIVDAAATLTRADQRIRDAESAFQRGEFHEARMSSRQAMKLLRILQRSHWEAAVRSLTFATASPHAVSYQTLPDHWKMIARLGSSPMKIDSNLIRSGDFEDIELMSVEGWQHIQDDSPDLRRSAELYQSGRSGNYCLRLVAAPAAGNEIPQVIDKAPVTVKTPPVLVRAGQVVHVGGWARVVAPIAANFDGATLSDNLLGNVAAIRWNEPQEWQPFELIREIQQSGELQLTITLHGLGEIHFDDLQINTHTPRRLDATGVPLQDPEPEPESRSGPLDFFSRLPKLSPRKP